MRQVTKIILHRAFGVAFFISMALTSSPGLAKSVAEPGLYPTAAAARQAYYWLQLQPDLFNFINGRSGWAIEELDVKPRSLPTGILAQYHFSSGWTTFGLVLPVGAAHGGLKVGDLAAQTDVKVRWPDGSIRFAVVSANIPKSGEYSLQQAPLAIGSFVPKVPDVRIILTIGGVPYTASLPQELSTDLWLSGPFVKEAREVVTPKNSSGVSHAFLRVIFDTRVYADGAARLDITVENVLDVSEATSEVYNVSIISSGKTLFEKGNVTHWYLSRWRKVFKLGLLTAEVIPDFEPFHRAGALPRYLSSIQNEIDTVTGSTYEILRRGATLYEHMGAPGGRPEIVPYPDGTACYIVHKEPQQLVWLLANGDLAGSWPVHIREVDGSLVSIDKRPRFWLDTRGGDMPAGNMSARGPLQPDNAHQSSWAYVPYLITGDRYYADEMAFWANYVLLFTWYARRGGDGSEGLLIENETRGIGWGLRNMIDAAALLPDTDPMKPYFVAKVNNNLTHLDRMASEFDVPPTGVIHVHTRTKEGVKAIAQWEHNYLGWALHHASEQGLTGGSTMLLGIAGFQSKLFTSEPAYGKEYGAPYELAVKYKDTSGQYQYYQSMEELFNANYLNPDGSTRNPVPFNRDYAGSARLMLMVMAGIGEGPKPPARPARLHIIKK